MKILVMSQYFYPENFRVNDFCTELVKRGHSVTVLTGYPSYPKGEIYDGYGFFKPYAKEWNGIKIERIKMKPRGKTPVGLLNNCYSYVVQANKWIKKCEEKYDIIYVFEVSPVTVGLPALTYKKKFKTPIAFNVQDLWPENVESVLGIHFKPLIKLIDYIVDKIYKNSDYILCSSQGFVKNIKARGVDKSKLYFWPQFCNVPKFETMRKPKEYSEEYFNVVFTGNVGYAQGLDLFIDTAEELKNEKIRLFLVGDGRAKKQLYERAKEKGLEKNVVFVGKVDEDTANEYVYFADCAYLSFKDDKLFDMTIPAKLQTYLACGTPIVAAAGGESAEIIKEAQCGIATKRDKKSVAEAVKILADMSKTEYENMRFYAEQYFETHFKKEKVVNCFEDIVFKNSKKDSIVKM